MPFVEPLQHFEMADWARTPGLRGAVARYELSGLSGLPAAGFAGWVATLLAALGLVASAASRDSTADRTLRWGVVAWWVVSAILLLGNPLAWQRYYLPLVPPTAMLATLGILCAAAWLKERIPRSSR
jgi:hypothetical protein